MPSPTHKTRFFVPEVIQTSAMDCGPAALKALLEGHGILVDYEKLRSACQTDVDGTSIDSLEELAVTLGLDAEQVIVPVDHVLLDGHQALPAIAVVTLPSGDTHFVIAWRKQLGRVQMMDPASGRQWVRPEVFERQLYVHTMAVDPAAWRDWAGSDDFLDPLHSRMSALGIPSDTAAALQAWALESPGWQRLAGLDAAVRFAAKLAESSRLSGQDNSKLVEVMAGRSDEAGASPEELIPSAYWTAQAAPDDPDLILVTGAVLVKVNGVRTAESEPLDDEASTALADVLETGERGVLLRLWQILGRGRWTYLVAAMLAVVALAAGTVAEAMAFRGIFAAMERLDVMEQRLGLVAVMSALFVILLGLELSLTGLLLRVGRRLEVTLRQAFFEKLPRLGDHYFRSRPGSDLAERAHSLYAIRHLPEVLGHLGLAVVELVMTVAAICWLYPAGWLPAVLAGLAAMVIPLVMRPWLTELDLRRQVHEGAMSGFYLDATRGLLPIRAHGARRNVQREHESLASEWGRAVLAYVRGLVGFELASNLLITGLIVWLVLDFALQPEQPVGVLVVAYWSLKLPMLARQLGQMVRTYPALRNTASRLLEPLGARDVHPPLDALKASAKSDANFAWGLEFDDVSVRAAGRTILEDINVEIGAGEHVALVGPSGAGKSSFLGLMLGWYAPAKGRVLVDGEELDHARLVRLRHQIAWLDPDAHLWNRSLWDNIRYGCSPDEQPLGMDQTLAAARLEEVVERLPEGLSSWVGEEGGVLSGGEGQRVRLARALQRQRPPLALCDEAFRGIDGQTRRQLLGELRAYWADSTLLFVSHDVEHTLAFDRVLVFFDGQIIEDGDPDALAAQEGTIYAKLLERERQVKARLLGEDEEGWTPVELTDGSIRGGSA
ncbi:ATP-binding cassette domain-containing protein [Persicimonas caeni]|uniref:ATP-binding cassette domain-containing protein n=1 Tax=Persicimonas caeni TaxID=2292766 RepID=A0A4Y6PN09_PERCE|nr:ATP-binding cassette domain-containing protein [Persicimonas caeni]QDG49407.1 ATP-binding cassette domain-containing protein [Persicimonas caeni]QED30628.1 ATP-binding cassette domain-containing protein [Persicimonas caeni]